jgi:hypothetical protein
MIYLSGAQNANVTITWPDLTTESATVVAGTVTTVDATAKIRTAGKYTTSADGISQTAVRKYGEDYTIEWRGKPVLAAGHIKRGKHAALYRIHVYFDPDTRETVVAHIGRHLRDAGAN